MSNIITKGGYYHNKIFRGMDKSQMQRDVALLINTQEDVGFSTLDISECGIPIRKIGLGKLEIDHLILSAFSADAFNLNSNVHIHHLEVDYYNPSYVYSNRYHVDALGQFFSIYEVSNITIDKITARIRGKNIQGMMLSEPINYSNFSIGVEGCDIEIEYPYAFVANTLKDSFLNLGDNQVKIKKVKPCRHKTSNVWVETKEGIIYHDKGDIVT